MSIAAVGDSAFVTAFEFLGAYGFIAEDEDKVKIVLKRLMDDEDFKIIILSERFAKATLETRMRVIKNVGVYPLFAILPDIKGEGRGERIKEIKSYISLAMGVELK